MPANELIELATKYYDTSSIDLLKKAIDFAAKKHEGQMRKSGEPYITHPLSVGALLVEWGMDTDTVVAGVLHDTLEDTDTTLAEIEEIFSRDIAFLVDGVTKVSKARSGMRDLNSYLPATKDNLAKLLIAKRQYGHANQ